MLTWSPNSHYDDKVFFIPFVKATISQYDIFSQSVIVSLPFVLCLRNRLF